MSTQVNLNMPAQYAEQQLGLWSSQSKAIPGRYHKSLSVLTRPVI